MKRDVLRISNPINYLLGTLKSKSDNPNNSNYFLSLKLVLGFQSSTKLFQVVLFSQIY